MRLMVDEKGFLKFEGNISEDMDIFAGSVKLGQLTKEECDFPLHSLVQNIQRALEFGVTAKSVAGRNIAVIDIDNFVETYIQDDTISKLRSSIKGGKWVIYSMYIEKSRQVNIDLGIVLPMSLAGRKFSVRCEGEFPKKINYYNDKNFEKSHWFMPTDYVLGMRCSFDLDILPKYLEFNVDFYDSQGSPEVTDYRPIMSFTDLSMVNDLPSLGRIKRTCSVNANQSSYLNGGRTAYVRLLSIAKKYGVALSNERLRILDWGVGCGRLIKHFEELPSKHLWGIDIDADNVEYCNGALRSRSLVVDLYPPTSLKEASFDLVYSCSVLSHLTEIAANGWLAEIGRLLSADGIALLSFNGSSNAASYLSRRRHEFRVMIDKGFFDGDANHELDGFIPGEEYYRATFATDLWWRRKFEEYFDVCAIEFGVVNGYQDIAVVRKKCHFTDLNSQ